MNTISARISKLEERFAPRLDEQGRNTGETLRERARRYNAEYGRELDQNPAPPLAIWTGRIGEMLRFGRFRQTQASFEIATQPDNGRTV